MRGLEYRVFRLLCWRKESVLILYRNQAEWRFVYLIIIFSPEKVYVTAVYGFRLLCGRKESVLV